MKTRTLCGTILAAALPLATSIASGCPSAPVRESPAYSPDVNSAVSPDGRNEIRLYSSPLAYEVVRDGVVVAAKTEIGLKMNGGSVGESAGKPCDVRRTMRRLLCAKSSYAFAKCW